MVDDGSQTKDNSFIYFKSDDDRAPLQLTVEATFNKLVQIVSPPVEVAELIKLIFKIVWVELVDIYLTGLSTLLCSISETDFFEDLCSSRTAAMDFESELIRK
ncbi:hypothetical protein Droror1_Dr00026556 [Drosera rotundifolia]